MEAPKVDSPSVQNTTQILPTQKQENPPPNPQSQPQNIPVSNPQSNQNHNPPINNQDKPLPY